MLSHSHTQTDVVPVEGLAAKVARRDTLAMRLHGKQQQSEKQPQSDLSLTVANSTTANDMSGGIKSNDEKSAIRSHLTR